jgi:hypothetical protein
MLFFHPSNLLQMKKIWAILIFMTLPGALLAQQAFVEAGVSFGSGHTAISAAGTHNWTLGKKKKFLIGTGLRLTTFSGTNKYFSTAPASLSTNDASVDSLLVAKPAMTSLNAVINLGYRVTDNLEVGFNIDAIGVSFGSQCAVSYLRNGRSTASTASPTSVNVLLIGDNDRGSLNSHLYAKYRFNGHWGAKVAFEHLFNELTTTTAVQTLPEANDRFRIKTSNIYVGLVYHF